MARRSRNREINIFSMSALDLFASALGAFILIAIILLPFFPTTEETPAPGPDEGALEDAQQQIATLQGQLADLEAQLETAQGALASGDAAAVALRQAQQQAQQCADQLQSAQSSQAAAESASAAAASASQQMQEDLQRCQQLAKRTFVLIVVSWSTRDDVDLHVVDPQGREFFWRKKTHGGTPAKLEEDNVVGPGNEIWLHPNAGPGRYQIYYKYYTRRTRQVDVRGAVLVQDGRRPLRLVRLQRVGEKPRIATVVVDNQGNVRIDP